MDTIATATKRIHPLMAAAAVSVIIACAAGTAAITGILPTSHGATAPQADPAAYPALSAQNTNPAMQAGQAGAQPYGPTVAQAAAAPSATYVQQAPEVQQSAPVVHRTTHHVVHHRTEVAQYDEPRYEQRQVQPAPSQPNYVAMGTGAVIGGLVGNQVGSGNGRKLATVAGIIGGGFLGNEIANHNR